MSDTRSLLLPSLVTCSISSCFHVAPSLLTIPLPSPFYRCFSPPLHPFLPLPYFASFCYFTYLFSLLVPSLPPPFLSLCPPFLKSVKSIISHPAVHHTTDFLSPPFPPFLFPIPHPRLSSLSFFPKPSLSTRPRPCPRLVTSPSPPVCVPPSRLTLSSSLFPCSRHQSTPPAVRRYLRQYPTSDELEGGTRGEKEGGKMRKMRRNKTTTKKLCRNWKTGRKIAQPHFAFP